MPVRLENQMEPIPGYRLLERLGQGGFGEVWKAEAPGGLLKAIKFVHGNLEAGDRDNGVAAEQELKALSRVKSVRHPFILSLERFDIVEGQLIIVMELADRNLWDRFKDCRAQALAGIPRDELLGYLEEAAEALDLMNQEYQLQHLDIKPQNLFLVHNHVKVADFGLVKDLEGMKASVTGGVTPLYAAPETFDGWVSRYSDQYSLAIVFQELLTGQRPFNGTNPRQLILQHLTAPPDLSALSAGDQAILRRALAKKPEDRFPACKDLIKALRAQSADVATAEAPATGAPPTVPGAPPRPDTDATPTDDSPTLGRDRRAPVTPQSDMVRSPLARTPGRQTPGQFPALYGEATGAGLLFPALVVGIGEMGLHVLQRLREGLHQRFGAANALPNLRLLHLDTDPEVFHRCPEAGSAGLLPAAESLLLRLNRPSHYLKPREGQQAFYGWIEPKILYRMPRNQTTAGLRSLGRLALMDHHATLVQRLGDDLRAVADAQALAAAGQRTGLGVASSQPRIYVVCGLGGGTGSGMFLDLAYLARNQLRQLGFAFPEVRGLFLLPSAEPHPTTRMALANCCAALTELAHFGAPDVTYSVRFGGKEGTIEDPAAPFERCLFLPLPPGNEEGSSAATAGLAGGWLLRELTTSLGRAADQLRERAAPGPVYQTASLYRLAWPRQALARRTARQLSVRVVQHWTDRDSQPVKQEIANWIAEQWPKRKLAPEFLIDSLETTCEQALGESPTSAWELITGRLARRTAGGLHVEPESAALALQQLTGLLGRPEDDGQALQNGTLLQTLDGAIRELLAECEQKVAEMAVGLVEQPRYRLAGAEEAIRQAAAALEQLVQGQQDNLTRLSDQAGRLSAQLQTSVQILQTNPALARRKASFFPDLIEAFRQFPEVRFRALVLQGMVTIYRHMQTNCPEYLRELGFCRVRLGELQRAIETRPLVGADAELGPVHHLLPSGCRNLDEAATAIANTITTDELLEFDAGMQGQIRRNYKALVHVCMTAANFLRELEAVLPEHAEAFLQARLGKANAVETLLESQGRTEDAAKMLPFALAGAEPKLTADVGGTELRLLLLPADTGADRLQTLAKRCLPQVEVVMAGAGDDLVFYRERSGLSLGRLPQLSAAAREAYQQMIDRDHFSPHSRSDIASWRAP